MTTPSENESQREKMAREHKEPRHRMIDLKRQVLQYGLTECGE